MNLTREGLEYFFRRALEMKLASPTKRLILHYWRLERYSDRN
jgi:hypothetical protein